MLFDELIKEFQLIKRLRTSFRNEDFFNMQRVNNKSGIVLFIPGWNEFYNYFNYLNSELNKSGIETTIAYGKDLRRKMEDIVRENVDYILRNDLKNILIIGHSRGGLVAKHIIDNYPEINSRVKKLVALGVPWHGGIFTKLPLMNLYEMNANTKFMIDINANKQNLNKIVNIYSRVDDTVIPNSSLYLDGVENIKIDIVGHRGLMWDKRVVDLLVGVLGK